MALAHEQEVRIWLNGERLLGQAVEGFVHVGISSSLVSGGGCNPVKTSDEWIILTHRLSHVVPQ
jgi:hypothetical protein